MSHFARKLPVLALLVRSARVWYQHALPMVVLNVAWAALSVTIVLAPWAMAALFYAANRAAYCQPLSTRAVLGAVRRFAVVALVWGIVSGLVWVGTFGAVEWRVVDRSGILAIVLVLFGLLWTVMQLYFWPLLFEQRDKGFIAVLRSSLLLIPASPGYTLTLFVAVTLLLLLSVALRFPLLVFTPSFVAVTANLAVLDRLALLGYPPDPAHTEQRAN